MNLDIAMKQTVKLAPQMLLSTDVLQMSSQELEAYLENLEQENPAAELEPPKAPAEPEELEAAQSRVFGNRERRSNASDAGDGLRYASTDGGLSETLQFHLKGQLRPEMGTKQTVQAARLLVDCLDENGYFRESLAELSAAFGIKEKALSEGLRLLQTLDPPGVGARSLEECLSLQLRRNGADGAAIRIAEGYLRQLARRQYHAIAQSLGISQEAVLQAERQIRALEPYPGAAFVQQDLPAYVSPDVVVLRQGTAFAVVLRDTGVSQLQINSYYRSLWQSSEDREVQKYLSEKIRQVEWVLQAIEQRRTTLQKCAEWIVRYQAAFFQSGGQLRPLCLQQAAEGLSLHASTISRTIREKYLQCDQGTFPLHYFFSREVGGESADGIKAALAALVEAEDRTRPMSDQKLCEQLEKQGYRISRRTAAKYRDELGIPPAGGRRLQKIV